MNTKINNNSTVDEIFELFQTELSLFDKGFASDYHRIDDRRLAREVAEYIVEHKCTVTEAYFAFESKLDNLEPAAGFFASKLRALAFQ
jgi:hypothetical protein